MSHTSGLSAVLATVCAAGCALSHPPVLPPPRDPVPLHGDRAALWKVGVIEPVLRSGDDEPRHALEEISTAASLVGTLRRIDLFHEVDFARQLRCPTDVEVVALPEVDDLELAPLWLQILTLSIKGEQHVSILFHPVTAPEEQIELTYQSGYWVGLAPMVLSPLAFLGALGDWRLDAAPDLETRALRAQLLEKGGVLERHLGQSVLGHCPEMP